MPVATFLMTSDPLSVRDGLRRIMAQPPLAQMAEGDRGTAEIVLAEVLNNIVEHAYAAVSGPIRLTLDRLPGQTACVIEDEGAAMPGGRVPAGKLPDPADLAEGGFGWHLILSLTSDLAYRRQGRVNRLSFTLRDEPLAKQSGG